MSLFGGLCRTLIAHPELDSSHDSPVEQAIVDLRYGSIGVNTWTAAVYGIRGLTWGAYPGESLDNVASGQGFVRNAYMLKGIERVSYAPHFKPEPTGHRSQWTTRSHPRAGSSRTADGTQARNRLHAGPPSRNGQETFSHSPRTSIDETTGAVAFYLDGRHSMACGAFH